MQNRSFAQPFMYSRTVMRSLPASIVSQVYGLTAGAGDLYDIPYTGGGEFVGEAAGAVVVTPFVQPLDFIWQQGELHGYALHVWLHLTLK
jgi:hypothetical protein